MKGRNRKQWERMAGQTGERRMREAEVHRYPHPIRTSTGRGTDRELLERILEEVTRQSEQVRELGKLLKGGGEGIDNK